MEAAGGTFAPFTGEVCRDRVYGRPASIGGVYYNLQTGVGWYCANGIVVHSSDFTPYG